MYFGVSWQCKSEERTCWQPSDESAPCRLLFLHARVLLRVKEKRAHVTGYTKLLACSYSEPLHCATEKSLQTLSALRRGRGRIRHSCIEPKLALLTHSGQGRRTQSDARAAFRTTTLLPRRGSETEFCATTGWRDRLCDGGDRRAVPRIQRAKHTAAVCASATASAGSSHVLRPE